MSDINNEKNPGAPAKNENSGGNAAASGQAGRRHRNNRYHRHGGTKPDSTVNTGEKSEISQLGESKFEIIKPGTNVNEQKKAGQTKPHNNQNNRDNKNSISNNQNGNIGTGKPRAENDAKNDMRNRIKPRNSKGGQNTDTSDKTEAPKKEFKKPESVKTEPIKSGTRKPDGRNQRTGRSDKFPQHTRNNSAKTSERREIPVKLTDFSDGTTITASSHSQSLPKYFDADVFRQDIYDPPVSDIEYGKDCPFTDFSKAYNPSDLYSDLAESKASDKTPDADEEKCTVIGVRFRLSSKIYYFDPDGIIYPGDTFAIVDTSRGLEYGYVSSGNHEVPLSCIVQPLRKAIRPATKADKQHFAENLEKEDEAGKLWTVKVNELGLGMKLIGTEYTFDNSKLLFFFTAEGRVDFRELLRILASIFHCRIELRQMGIRDEAKILGGLGICGRPLCCAAFLPDFTQVSIKMAKEQTISLNSSKISGTCGRLMCCLRYEHETYMEAIRKTPPIGSVVTTPLGDGIIIEAKPLVELLKVRLNANPDAAPSVFRRDEVNIIKKAVSVNDASKDDDAPSNEPK